MAEPICGSILRAGLRAKGYAPASIVQLWWAETWAPALVDRDHGWPVRQRLALPRQTDSTGLFVTTALRRPSQRQQFVKLLHGPTIDALGEDAGQVSL